MSIIALLVKIMDMPSQKHLLRHQIRKKRQRISLQERYESAQVVVRSFWSEFCDLSPCVVAGYWPTLHEFDIRPLFYSFYEQGWPCTLPRAVQHSHLLEFRVWTPFTLLYKDAANILSPDAQQPQRIPSLLFVPILAFDKQRRRLGQGGGYYDRTLMALRKIVPLLVIGIAFTQQMVDNIPQEPHDQKLDTIITQHFIFKD